MLRRGIYSSGKLGGVPSFDFNLLDHNGSNQYSTIADSPDWDLGSNDFGISFWVDLDSLPSNAWFGFVGQRTAFNSNLSWQIEYQTNGGENRWNFGSNNSATTFTWDHTPTLNTLYHLFFRRIGDDLDLFINGVKQATRDASGWSINTSSEVVSIGAEKIGGSSWASFVNGRMGCVEIWNNRTIKDEGVSQVYNGGVMRQPWERQPGLKEGRVLALPYNTGCADGRRFTSHTDSDHVAVPVNSPTFTGAQQSFEFDPNKFNMMQFTGSPQSVTNPAINIGNKYTISLRFYHNDFSPSDQNQFDMNLGSGNANTGPRLEACGATPELKLHWASAANGTGLGDTVILNLGAISAQRVYDFAMTMDNGSVVAYLDGEQVGSSPSTHGFETVFNGIAWGNGFSTRYMDGSVSDVMLFDDALSIEEIKIIHNKKTPKFYDKLPRSIREKCVLAMPLNSNDDSALDITGYGVETAPIIRTHTWGGSADVQRRQLDLSAATSDYLQVTTDSADWDMGTGQFTLEAFKVKFKSFPDIGGLDDIYRIVGEGRGITGTGPRKTGWSLAYNHTTNELSVNHYDGSTVTIKAVTWTATADVEYDIAADRDGDNIYIYVDGVQIGTTQTGVSALAYDREESNGLYIGSYEYGGGPSTSYADMTLDAVRISKGVARYTGASYTVPNPINDVDTVYINVFKSSDGSTPAENTIASSNGTKNGGIVADGAEINVSNEQFSPVDLGGCLLSINADDGFVDLSPLQQAVTNTGGVTIVPNAYNGKATFSNFGGNYISVPDIISGTGSKSMYAVYKSTSNSPPYVDAVCGQGSGAVVGSFFVIQSRVSGPAGDPYFAGFGADLGSDSPDNLLKQAGVTYDGVTARLRKNRALNDSGPKSLDTVATTFKIGNNDVGGSPEPFDGDIPTVSAFDRDLNASEEAMLESFNEEHYAI